MGFREGRSWRQSTRAGAPAIVVLALDLDPGDFRRRSRASTRVRPGGTR
jgi:hypothetical protein